MVAADKPGSWDVKALDTLPKWLRHNAETYGDTQVAMRHKDFGVWNAHTWQDCYQRAKYFGLGLLSLGLSRGDKVAIVGDNDPYWYWAEYATQAVGGIVLGLFVDCIPTEARHIVENSDSKFIVAKDQEQVDKMLGFVRELSQVKKIIYWEYKGMWSYEDPLLIGWEEVEELGRKYEQDHPGAFEENIEQGRADEYAIFLYTSGTSGLPKGAMHTHKTLLACGRSVLSLFPWTDKHNYVSAFAPGYVGDQMFGVCTALMSRTRVNFPESGDTVIENIREVAPEFIMFTGRMWEGMVSAVKSRMLDSSRLKQLFYNLFLAVGYKKADLELADIKPGWFWRALYFLGDWLVFRPVKDKIGLVHLRNGVSAGSPVSPDCLRFLRAIGVPMQQAYAFSELVAASGHLMTDSPDADTVGRVAPGSEVRITDANEILVRSDGLFIGYYKDPVKTDKARGDGWFHSGDAGTMNNRGQVIFWDRLDDLFELRSGVKFPPQYIEGKLKFSPYILDCMVLGGEHRDFVAGIVAIDFDVCGRWAERNSIAYTTFTDLSQKQEIIELVKKDIQRVNLNLPPEQRVKKFANLYKQFDADEAELTRTRKLRRGFMEERYKEMIDSIYAGQDEYAMETSVTYRDGSKGIVKTTIKVVNVE